MKLCLLLSCVLIACGASRAAPVAVAGTMTYAQDFNALGTGSPSWVNDSTIPGWYVQLNNGATAPGAAKASDGTDAGLNGLLNLGAAGDADRALGSRATSNSGNANIAYAVQFRNTSAWPVQVTRIVYTGELWRTNDTTVGSGQSEAYTVFTAVSPAPVANIASGTSSDTAAAGPGFTAAGTAANWSSPRNTPVGSRLDGNAAANRTTVNFVPAALVAGPGEYLVIKWTDTNRPGTDGYQAIDDVSVEFTSLRGLPGDVDGYNPGADADVTGIALETGGTAIVTGGFTLLGGVFHLRIGRINPDGTVDDTFNTNVPSGQIRNAAIQADGKILFCGSFLTVNGVYYRNIARIFASGNRDDSFGPQPDDIVYGINIQPDTALIFHGDFSAGNGGTSNRISRYSQAGDIDLSFNPAANNTVRTTVLQTDGRIVLGGNFTQLTGTARTRVARILANGTTDLLYGPGTSGTVYCLAVQGDGRMLIAGSFTDMGGVPRNRLARLNTNGTVDLTFNPNVNDTIRTLLVQADGKLIIGGQFTAVAGMPRVGVARINGDGTLDTSFAPVLTGNVIGAAQQADGKVIIGGDFTAVSGAPRSRIARLSNNVATQSLTASDKTRLQWLRGGSSPEAQYVTFEISTTGGSTWTLLGTGTRIAGGWELTGLSLPASGLLRVRARTGSGYNNGSTGLMETVAPLVVPTPQQIWRQANFGTPDNSGPAADNADPDKDGLENLIEFAFGRNPLVPDAAALPQWMLSDDDYVLTFIRPAGVDGITFVAEFSTSMAAGSWTPAVNISTPPDYTFLVPASTQRLYLRVRVTAP